MNIILKDGLMLLVGIVIAILFAVIKNKIFKTAKQEVIKIIPEEDKIKIKELYEKGLVPKKVYDEVCAVPKETEGFDTKKLTKGLLSIGNPVLWAKELSWFFNARKLIIIGIVIGVIYGYGYWKGKLGVQPILNWRGKEEWASLNEHYLHIKPDGTLEVVDKDKKTVLKKITVGDLEILKKNLKPYGFKFEPIAVAGLSAGTSGAGAEAGAGLSWAKYYKWNLDAFLTNRGLYPLATSYQITNNSGIGLGAGFGFKNAEKRIILYYKWKF